MLDMDEAYREYAQMVYKFLLSLCYEEELAEELTQETFYQAVRTSKKYDGSCKVSTWLCQIAKHLWYRELERRNKRGTSELTDQIPVSELPPDEYLALKEEKMELFRKVHVLDETAKEIVLLRVTGAFSFREIGELFGKNENWARVTYYRAKQKIAKGGKEDDKDSM